MIHRLALRTIRRDGVTRQELTETFVQHPAIGEFNPAIGLNGFHGDEFAICGALARRQFTVGLELESVAARD